MNKRPNSYKSLVRMRIRMTLTLFVILFALLTINLILMSTADHLGARPISEGSPISVSLLVCACSIVFGAITSMLYVYWATSKLDPLVEQARSDLEAEPGEAQ